MTNKTVATTHGDLEIAVTRHFDAPRTRVFDAFTRPELVQQWMHGPSGWILERCELDLSIGGTLRYEWRGPNGETMGMTGRFREIDVPSRTVHTELFDEDWTGGETVVTTDFREESGGTTVIITTQFGSKAARDAAIKTGMAEGMEASFVHLERTLNQG